MQPEFTLDPDRIPAAPRRPLRRPGPVGGRRDRNRRRRTHALLQAALQLFLERGIESVPIDEIAARAGMAKGNFYRYFPNKAALVETLMIPLANPVREALKRCAQALQQAQKHEETLHAFSQLGAELIEIMLAQIGPLRLFLQECRGPDSGARAPVRRLADELHDHAVELTRIAMQRGLLRQDDPRITSTAVVGAAEALVLGVLQGRIDNVEPLRIVDSLVRMVIDGLRA